MAKPKHQRAPTLTPGREAEIPDSQQGNDGLSEESQSALDDLASRVLSDQESNEEQLPAKSRRSRHTKAASPDLGGHDDDDEYEPRVGEDDPDEPDDVPLPLEPPKRGRGRPRKNPQEPAQPTIKRGRGRPPKKIAEPQPAEEGLSDDEVVKEQMPPPPKRGPGRPPLTGTVSGIPAKLEIKKIGATLNESARKDLEKIPSWYKMADTHVAELQKRDDKLDSLENVQRYLRRPDISAHFSKEDQSMVSRKWRGDPARARKLDHGGNKKIVSLYKDCLCLLRCLPEDIICQRNYLEYDDSDHKSSLVWGADFCASLKTLVCHPFWMADINLLVTAIHYTIITISDDRHPWKFHTKASDTFPSRVQKLSRKGGNRSMRDIRLKAVEEMKADGIQNSIWNLLFERIEGIATRKAYSDVENLTKTGRTANAPYKVHRLHLEMLMLALDSTAPMGWPIFQSSRTSHYGVSGRRTVEAYPKESELPKLREYAIHRSMELDLQYANKTQTKFDKTQGPPSRAATAGPASAANLDDDEPSEPIPRRSARKSAGRSANPAPSVASDAARSEHRVQLEVSLPPITGPKDFVTISDDEYKGDEDGEDEENGENEGQGPELPRDFEEDRSLERPIGQHLHSQPAPTIQGRSRPSEPRGSNSPSRPDKRPHEEESENSETSHHPPKKPRSSAQHSEKTDGTSVEVAATQLPWAKKNQGKELPTLDQQLTTQSSNNGTGSQGGVVPETPRSETRWEQDLTNQSHTICLGAVNPLHEMLPANKLRSGKIEDISPEEMEEFQQDGRHARDMWRSGFEGNFRREWPTWLDETDSGESEAG